MADQSKVAAIPQKSESILGIEDGRLPQTVNNSFRVIIPASKFINVPGFPTLKQGIVRIRAHNGTVGGNAGVIYVTTSRDAAMNPTDQIGAPNCNVDIIPPGAEVPYPVENLAELWIAGTAADGAFITVKGII